MDVLGWRQDALLHLGWNLRRFQLILRGVEWGSFSSPVSLLMLDYWFTLHGSSQILNKVGGAGPLMRL
jgi:hypothetical protein